jgi:hypothetical protein
MGIGNLQRVIAAYNGEQPSYAQLYFGSAPDVHRGAWRRLAALAYESRLQARKLSSEEVLHPRYRTPRFATPNAIVRAWKQRVLKAIPRNPRRTHLAISVFMGSEAHKLGRSERIYRGLRAPTLAVLHYIGRRVHEISATRKPLLVTSAVRDNRYQRVLMNVNAKAARTYSIHTTGYAFDVARSYANRRQAAAFQFALDRLVAVNAIPYIREAEAIHVAVASDAERKLRLLARAI